MKALDVRDAERRHGDDVVLVDREGPGLLDVDEVTGAEGETPRYNDAVPTGRELDTLCVVLRLGQTPSLVVEGRDESAVGDHADTVHRERDDVKGSRDTTGLDKEGD